MQRSATRPFRPMAGEEGERHAGHPVASHDLRAHRRDARPLRGRAARPWLRAHLRQQPAPRAAVVARGRGRHLGPHRGRAARVHHHPGRPRGRHRHHPQPPRAGLPPARRDRRDRGRAVEGGSGRGHRRRHLGAGRPRDPQPGARDRQPRGGRPPRHDPHDHAWPRLRAGRAEQGPGHDHRGHPGRLELLARPSGAVRGEPGPRGPAHRLRQAHPRDPDRRERRPAGRDGGGGRDPHRAARDLRRPRQPPHPGRDRGRGAARRAAACTTS